MSAIENTETIELRPVPQEDWFLQNLISNANIGKFTMGITLNVGGLLVSGNLVGGREYFENFGSMFLSKMSNQDDKTTEDVESMFREYAEIYDREPDQANPPNFVHLKDVEFFGGTRESILGKQSVWWRGRVSEIQGFFLGNLLSGT